MAKKPAGWYVLSRLDHDGRRYEPGERVEAIADAQAEALHALGVLSSVEPRLDPEQPETPATVT